MQDVSAVVAAQRALHTLRREQALHDYERIQRVKAQKATEERAPRGRRR